MHSRFSARVRTNDLTPFGLNGVVPTVTRAAKDEAGEEIASDTNLRVRLSRHKLIGFDSALKREAAAKVGQIKDRAVCRSPD